MRTFAVLGMGIALALPLAAEENPRAQGYVYYGLTGADGTTMGKWINPGLGAELFLFKGLAGSADVGYVGYYNNFKDEGFGLFSPNVSYHFFNSTKFVPFVTAGYSMAFRNGTLNMGNYGGGVTYWFSRRFGVRVEGRDHRATDGYHISGIRFGVSFR